MLGNSNNSNKPAHSNPWLLFPWQQQSSPSQYYDDDNNNNNDDDDPHTTVRRRHDGSNNNTTNSSAAAAEIVVDNNPNRLTQFPPYGQQQQQRYTQELPHDWLNHLAHLSSIPTKAEVEQQQQLQLRQQQQQQQASGEGQNARSVKPDHVVRAATEKEDEDYYYESQLLPLVSDADWDRQERNVWWALPSSETTTTTSTTTHASFMQPLSSTTTNGTKQQTSVSCCCCVDCQGSLVQARRILQCRYCCEIVCRNCLMKQARMCRDCQQQRQQKTHEEEEEEEEEVKEEKSEEDDLIAAAAAAVEAQSQQQLMTAATTEDDEHDNGATEESKHLDVQDSTTSAEPTYPIIAMPSPSLTPPSTIPSSSPHDDYLAGNVHLGRVAADHLEAVTRHLLSLHAPLIWNTTTETTQEKPPNNSSALQITREHQRRNRWVHQLLTLATRTASTVDPDVKHNGDLLDIRPHVKIKTIPGGDVTKDSVYWSGILFRNQVTHKTMVTKQPCLWQPRIVLLQDGMDGNQHAYDFSSHHHSASHYHHHGSSHPSSTTALSTASSRRRLNQSPSNASMQPSSGQSSALASGNGPASYQLTSLDSLREEEDKYILLLVQKMVTLLKPTVLLVGQNVCRKAQELLLQHNVVVIQHVKSSVLQRISRLTKATILNHMALQTLMTTPTDGGLDAINAAAELEDWVGHCQRFRLVTVRDNEHWVDGYYDKRGNESEEKDDLVDNNLTASLNVRSIESLLADPHTKHRERQSALAAKQLGEGVLNGSKAVQKGLAKRGVAQTYVMLEGCPKHLGCTVVLRGANKAALKQVKLVLRFLVNVAYNLRLETSFLRERSARIRPDFVASSQNVLSSSLCVDYGLPVAGKKMRPWNGGNTETIPRPANGEITAFDHQSILVTSVWMTEKSQCCPAEVKGICYYSMQDVALGQFLRDSCFNLSLKCQNPNCKKSVLDHSLSFVHNDGLVNITVGELEDELSPPSVSPSTLATDTKRTVAPKSGTTDFERPIGTWSVCKHCDKVVSPLRYVSENTWKFSFGKFLETFFYNRDAIFNAPQQQCSCALQSASKLYFGCGKLAAQFVYEPVKPFGVFVRRNLPMDASFQKEEALRRLDLISSASSKLFVKFDKHIDKVSRETRSLFNSPTVRPEHLQTVLSELNRMSTYVDEAAKTLQDRVASVSDNLRRHGSGDLLNEALFRFPWFARRYLFMLASAWNEKLSAAGQAITTMKKLASSSSNRDGSAANVSIGMGDPLNEELMESMKQLRKLNEHFTRYNMTDITQVLPALPGSIELQQDGDYEDEFDKEEASPIDFNDGIDADVLASRRRLQSKGQEISLTRPTKSLGTRQSDLVRSSSDDTATAIPKPTPGGAVKSAITRFFNRGGRENDPYTVDLGIFGEGLPRLAPGLNGMVVPVFDEHLSTIIAYSLSSTEYAKQFKYYSRHETPTAEQQEPSGQPSDAGKPSMDLNGNPSNRAVTGTQAPGKQQTSSNVPTSQEPSLQTSGPTDAMSIERRMLVRSKSHVKHTFRDFDEKGQATCKFVCTTYWATQFHAVRQAFLSPSKKTDGKESDPDEFEQNYIESLSSAYAWAASGGKSGASFSRTSDDRFVIKCISRTELQMFLDCAPAFFEYLSKACFHGLPTVLCKIVGVYQIGIHNRLTGKRTMEQVAVMQNIFYNRKITRVFDLKGSLRGRFASHIQGNKEDSAVAPANDVQGTKLSTKDQPANLDKLDNLNETSGNDDGTEDERGLPTLLDGDFLEATLGRPMPLTDRAKALFQMSILNDTLFLSIINVLDYSILVGIDEENMELVVGIIDFMRQYDILKQMERVGKSLPMVVGSEAPTIIQPPLYKARFSNAMERYFMGIPNKWTAI